MRWAEHVAEMGGRGMHIGYWWRRHKGRDRQEDQDVCEWIILERALERWDGALWTDLMRLRIGTDGGLL
jgi:hypothetical protein